MSDKVSIIAQINELLQDRLPGQSRIYGMVTEKAYQGKAVNAVGQEVVMIDDRYENILFHKRDGESKYSSVRFGLMETTPMVLCCYCKYQDTHDIISATLNYVKLSGLSMQSTGYNHYALDVLKKYFLIEDPLKHEGYNQDYYVFSFGYELYRYVTEICCDELS